MEKHKKFIKLNTGLWIDHRRAVILALSDNQEVVHVILSHADRQPGRIDGGRFTHHYESLLVSADDVRNRNREQHLNTYYDEIMVYVHEAQSLLIFGPGEAKGEFRKRLDNKKPGTRIAAVEATDKMTDRQIAAKVREFFLLEDHAIASS